MSNRHFHRQVLLICTSLTNASNHVAPRSSALTKLLRSINLLKFAVIYPDDPSVLNRALMQAGISLSLTTAF